MAAIYSGRYECLNQILYTKIVSSRVYNNEHLFAETVTRGLIEIQRYEIFKRLPGHERQYMPLNEYLFKILKPMLDDVLLMGRGYEQVFDEFEVLFALIVADINKQQGRAVWGPVGRFGWKQRDHFQPPWTKIIEEAKKLEEKWPPLVAGLFGGDYQRLLKLVEDLEPIIRDRNHW